MFDKDTFNILPFWRNVGSVFGFLFALCSCTTPVASLVQDSALQKRINLLLNRSARFPILENSLLELEGALDLSKLPHSTDFSELFNINLSEIETLILSQNNLQKKLLDWDFTLFSSLKILYLSQTQLTEIPPSLQKLSTLEELHLDGNSLSSIDSLETYIWDSLTFLNLSFNQLETVDPSLWTLPSLYFLYLSSNHLESLPLAQSPSALRHLYLSDNLLTQWQASQLENFPFLKTLYLDKNRLNSQDFSLLYTSLKEDKSLLTTLTLDHNSIILSLEHLDVLSALESLSIDKNSLSPLLLRVLYSKGLTVRLLDLDS